MKPEDFFRLMDRVPEADITEMMQNRRGRQLPSGQEDMMKNQTEHQAKKEIRMSKRGISAGFSVAAALLALNIGGGYLLLHGREAATPESVLSTQELSTQEEVVTESPQYVQLMQKFYTGLSNAPCDYDFTGMGMDLNESWENDDWKVTLHAVAGCDWVVFFFYDIEPKQGQVYEASLMECPSISIRIGGVEYLFKSDIMPVQDEGIDSNIWHFYGVECNMTGKPFFSGDESADTMSVTVQDMNCDNREMFSEVPLAFSPPVYAPQQHVLTSLLASDEEEDDFSCGLMQKAQKYPPTRCYVTPFGVFYYSDEDESLQGVDGSTLNGSIISRYFYDLPEDLFGSCMENDENGNPAVKLEFSELCSYGTNSMGDTGNFFAHLMFRKPLDLPEKTPDAINKTNETYEDQEPDQPLYCSLMQKLYTDSSNEPCDYDFTGMGMDLNKSWENDEWKLTLHAVTGCDWIVFYFYDIEPKQGQTYEQVMAEYRFLSLNLEIGDNMEHNGMTSSMPGEYGSFDGDVWHFFGMASSTTGRPLFRQEDAKSPALLHFTIHQEAEGAEEPFTIVTPDFEVKEYPLTENMPAEFFASLNTREDCSPEYLDLISQNPLTRCAVTPFGVLGFSDSCSGLGDRNSSYSNSICWPKSAEEAADDLFLLYFCNYGISNINGEGTVYVNALFRKPTDPQTFDWNNP